jgi:hypothetical protein
MLVEKKGLAPAAVVEHLDVRGGNPVGLSLGSTLVLIMQEAATALRAGRAGRAARG